jgi:tol-pal system protein YbgF
MMGYLHTHRGWAGVLVAFLVTALPACTMFKTKEDPQMAALRRELRQIKISQATTQKTTQVIQAEFHALEAKVAGLGDSVEALASRPEPQPVVTAPDESPPPSQVSHEPATPAVRAEPPATKVATASAPKKPAPEVKVKEATASDKHLHQREYDKAYAVYLEHRYDEALTLFKDFLRHYPQHDLADNAQYWIGEIYYDLEDYANAILAFKEVVTRHAEETKAPDALLKIGYAYVALDDPTNARVFLKRVIKNYPFSEAESKARTKLKELENL